MSIKLIGKNKFQVVSSTDAYIHGVHAIVGGGSFHISNNGNEDVIFLREGKESFFEKLNKYNPDNKVIYISKYDFEELCLFLKDPEAYIKEIDDFFEEVKNAKKEEEIINERTEEEDYEAQLKNYNPEFDNFNIDDIDSSFFETE